MTPKRLVEWAVAVGATSVIAVAVIAVAQDFHIGVFPRLHHLLGIDSPLVGTLLVVGIAASVATFVVFLFRATRGWVKFEALGLRIQGPSGPIVLWGASFLAVSVAIAVLLPLIPRTKPAKVLDRLIAEAVLQENRGTIERSIEELGCLHLDFVFSAPAPRRLDEGLSIDIYCSMMVDGGAVLDRNWSTALKTQKLAVMAPDINGRLVALLDRIIGDFTMGTSSDTLLHRYITDTGSALYHEFQVPYYQEWDSGIPPDEEDSTRAGTFRTKLLHSVLAATIIERRRDAIERNIKELGCLHLDFVFTTPRFRSQEEGMGIEIYCGVIVDGGALVHHDWNAALETQPLAVLAPDSYSRLVKMLDPLIANLTVATPSQKLLHRFITDSGSKYYNELAVPYYHNWRWGMPDDPENGNTQHIVGSNNSN